MSYREGECAPMILQTVWVFSVARWLGKWWAHSQVFSHGVKIQLSQLSWVILVVPVQLAKEPRH